MIKKSFLVIPAILILMGCSDKTKIEDAVRSHLKDPSSAQFDGLVKSDSGNFACTIWNAKNSMGGYSDWKIAELSKVGSDWNVTKIQGSENNCLSEGFKLKDRQAKMYEDIKDFNKSNQP